MPWPDFIDDGMLARHGVGDRAVLAAAMRPEEQVMRPQRFRAMKATRLSAARRLVDRMARSGWTISKRVEELDAAGEGLLIYDVASETHPVSFVVWSAAPESGADRLGRFYEYEYDFYGAIFSGRVCTERARSEAARMRDRVWAGRTDNECLGWTVANRSNRFFNHVIDSLCDGRQPDFATLASGGGYIIRNAGWYGNGRHGSRSWLSLPPDSPFAEPYFIDLLALYLWRTAGADVAEAAARQRDAGSARLSDEVRRYLGIGNSSGIGMVAALVRWPTWLATFCSMREVVRAYVVTRPQAEAAALDGFCRMMARAADYYEVQPAQDVAEAQQPAHIASGLRSLLAGVLRDKNALSEMEFPWAEIARRAAEQGCLEIDEQVTSLLVEVAPDFADAVAALMRKGMATPRSVEPAMSCDRLRMILESRFSWALGIDFEAPGAAEHFWYKSEENGENRRGERKVDPGLENETFVNVAGKAQELAAALKATDGTEAVGMFLLRYPDLTHMVARVQLAARMPYSELRANIIDRDFLPMDGIRFLLGIFGLEASAPYSTRWVRGVFFQGAPLASALGAGVEEGWMFPATVSWN